MKHNSENDKVEFNGRLITKDRARYILIANRTPVKQQASSYLISLVTMPLLVAYDLGRVVLGGAGIVAAQGLQVLGARDDRTIELLDNSQHMMKNGFIGLFTTPSYILYPFTRALNKVAQYIRGNKIPDADFKKLAHKIGEPELYERGAKSILDETLDITGVYKEGGYFSKKIKEGKENAKQEAIAR